MGGALCVCLRCIPKFAQAKQTRNDPQPDEYWLRYGVHTRVNSDRGDAVQRRHEFFCSKMRESLQPQLKDAKRLFGALEREIIYYRDAKKCSICEADVIWTEVDIHHIDQHAKGGPTTLENGALVHSHCHPKGKASDEFAKQWREKLRQKASAENALAEALGVANEEDDENGDGT